LKQETRELRLSCCRWFRRPLAPTVRKVIKIGMDSRTVLARFNAERQALALMDHPNIARVFDGGTTDAGQPFFVMELVHGVPITNYCDSKRFPVNARLELFVAVCQAVQHAHQKGIIHRDLKPSNVLVTEVDGRPTPKVIDFGVAKATEFDLTDQSLGDTGAIVGTPTYMSPEQADPTSMDIDTRTDTYALGVILDERLTRLNPSDTELQRNLAANHQNIGIVQRELGRPNEALASIERGRRILERLSTDNPSVAEFQSDLAKCENSVAQPPDEAAKAGLRKQALEWLTAERKIWSKLVESGQPQARPFAAQTLEHWKRDADLAGIRDGKELARLPEAERSLLKQLWADVDSLLSKAGAGKSNVAPSSGSGGF
jgi:serine/threonine protein kinase